MELDFNFGNQEGARLLFVEYDIAFGSGVSGTVEVGLNFDPQAAAPTSAGQMTRDERVFAGGHFSVLQITAVGVMQQQVAPVDIFNMNITIASNIQLQAFNTGAVARVVNCKVYYKRVQFTLAELGGRIAVRR